MLSQNHHLPIFCPFLYHCDSTFYHNYLTCNFQKEIHDCIAALALMSQLQFVHIYRYTYDTCTLKMQVLSCNANVRNACSVSACYEKDKLFCFQLKVELLFFTLFPWNKKQTQLFLTGIHFTNYTYFGTTDNGRNFRTCEISNPQSNINVTPLKWRMKHGLLGFPDRQDCK